MCVHVDENERGTYMYGAHVFCGTVIGVQSLAAHRRDVRDLVNNTFIFS